jgi:hypothetical protein
MYPVLTPLGLLIGKTAIRFAEEHGLPLNKYADGLSPAQQGLSPEQARKVNAELIWIRIG